MVKDVHKIISFFEALTAFYCGNSIDIIVPEPMTLILLGLGLLGPGSMRRKFKA
ncbi:MAG: PEP-CTERM sorting domain-containing protein [Syntrophaceae bacterium]|nr:PEP-CTERM sorting domain-containing protein [Syntrophaceae bacterium]